MSYYLKLLLFPVCFGLTCFGVIAFTTLDANVLTWPLCQRAAIAAAVVLGLIVFAAGVTFPEK